MEAAMRSAEPAPDSGSAPRRAHRTLPPGAILENRYEVQRVAGRGGMSTVYVARDLRFGQVERLCAVKEMFDIDPDQRVRALRLVNFERESALLATLSHPAIPRIYDYFPHNGLIYLVLELIDGHDLERVLASRRSPFPQDQIIRWAIEISDVLEMLHAQKPDPIIFRDLKPSNIMLRNSGQVVLVDFGIARTIQGRQRGTMIGTEGYAPPEQYRGIADARGDIYALGATLHHLATNSDPRLETPFTFHERPIRSLNPDISDDLSAVVMKMLAYNPADRYQSVADLRADLEDVQRRATILAYGLREVPAPAAPLNASSNDDPESTAPFEAPQPLTERKPAMKKRAARKKRSQTDSITDRVVWSVQTNDEVRGSATFDGQSFIIGSYDHSVYAVSAVDGSVRWRARTSRGVVSRPALHEGLAIFGSEDHSIYAVDRQSGDVRWTHRTGMPIRSSPAISGESVVIGSDDGQLYCVTAVSGDPVWKQRTWGPVRSSPVVGDSLIYVGCDDTYLYAVEPESGSVAWRAPSGGPIHSIPALAGPVVVIASRNGSVAAFDARTGRRAWQHVGNAAIISSPRVSQGIVVFGTVDGQLIGLNAHDGQVAWSARLANQITATALLAGNTGYIGTVDGHCLSFEVTTGELLWRHEVGGSIVSTPAYGAGVLVVGSTDGRVYGLTLSHREAQQLQKGT